jgi:hypothetical protein
MEMKPFVAFRKEDAPKYIALVDKFLTWAETASQRGDTLTKEVGTVAKPGWGKRYDKLIFVSQAPTEHFLSIATCAIGTCTGTFGLVFSASEARELRAMLEGLQAGRLEQTDLDEVYK